MTRPTPSHDSTPRGNDDRAIRDQLSALKLQQERLFAQLAHGQQHFKRLARSVWRVQEDERRRLARELHDGLGQNLTALRHQLDGLLRDAELEPDGRQRLETAVALCATTLEEARALSRMLRPQILDDLGLEPALNWLSRSVATGAGFVIEVDCTGLRQSLDGDLSTLVFRVAQEALTNVAKHSQATHVLIRLGQRDDELTLLVADDGRGCDPLAAMERSRQGDSTGLASIRERVALFGGRLSFVSERDEGTQVRVMLPLGQGTSTNA